MQPLSPFHLSKIKILIGAVLVIVAVALFVVLVVLPFHVVGTNPSSQSVTTLTPFFDIEFNKTLSSSGLAVSSNPSIVRSFSVQNKTLVINLSPLLLSGGKTYTITVNSVKSTSGQELLNKTFSFSPHQSTFSGLPSDQQAAILKAQQQGQSQPVNNDPILKYLPHGTLDYTLTAAYATVNGQTKLQLNAVLLLTGADLSTNQTEQAAISQYKSEVNQYITSLGLNPGNYSINYRY
jgi:hypothetical protein